ncbi:BCCT family transporter [Cellulophaga baltica]|uniref:BCCT family transporter n=1 Tax=Cellulophaga TaxID=104264 RepID=UPI00051D64AB|nr:MULTISPECIES: BCCT family transporter [Cellulophaga]KGK29367.1 glycine/betaine ABC transporter [Cellulophaga sp. E6(2014)]MCR1024454.1 BCCT family transporter [Cellulophaga baltica]
MTLKTRTKNSLLPFSIGILLLLSLIAFFATESSYIIISDWSLWVRTYFGYFYLYLGLACVFFLLIIAFSPIGKLKLGKKNSKPEYSLWSWIAMLYSAGMGAGILLRAVQEPIYMQQNPPYTSNLAPEILALEFTFYQWGFTAWAFYGLFAMVIAYALFVRKKKTLISETVSNTLPNKKLLYGIDILTILTTIFGLIAAVGLGTTQIKGGINHVFKEDFDLNLTIGLTTIIVIVAAYSAWMGVNKGIKMISKLNIITALSILIFTFVFSDVPLILSNFFSATYHYILDFIPMSLALGSYNPGMNFLSDWTFYYWAFWLAWAPFTGIFIARISKGRTLRQLLLGVLIIPSLGTFFWFAVFGSSAFELVETWGSYNNEFGNVFSSIFVFLENYPFAFMLNMVTLFLLASFLVTSVDSAVFVLSMFTDSGKKNPSKKHRLLWSAIILIATIALLVLGNVKPEIDVLTAVQKLLIITSLPFAFFSIFMAWVFLKEVLKKK